MRSGIKDGSTVYLVSCVGGKFPKPTIAKDLYTSAWFKKARHFVESKSCPWFVLSAEFGLVSPERIISPYEKTLNTMPISDRRKWAEMVNSQIEAVAPQLAVAVFLAGQRYRESLVDHLRKRNIVVQIPMEGLRIGEQLSWLGNHSG